MDDATRAEAIAAAEPQPLLTRLATLIRIAPEGLLIALSVALPGIIAIAFGLRWAGALVLLMSAAVTVFFRDPERTSQAAPGAILSGADGKVCDIREGPLPGGPRDQIYRQVSVFMSPLNVHVNRAPASGTIVNVQHTAGEFRAAFRDDASDHNERNLIMMAGEGGRRYAMVQVAGYLARRIVCRVHPEDIVERGQRIGLIMFGSRVDHFMPREVQVRVAVGDRVRAGLSIIGEF